MPEIPNTTVQCDGCAKDLSVLQPYVKMQVKTERQVITSTVPSLNEDPVFSLGTQSGAGEIVICHDFACLAKYVDSRTKEAVEIQIHYEEGDPYVPADNRSPEELAADGEITEEHAALLSGGN